jgi:hypothetical protein
MEVNEYVIHHCNRMIKYNILMYRRIARQRPVNISPQHIIALNTITSIARQPRSKHAYNIGCFFSVGSVRSLYNDIL